MRSAHPPPSLLGRVGGVERVGRSCREDPARIDQPGSTSSLASPRQSQDRGERGLLAVVRFKINLNKLASPDDGLAHNYYSLNLFTIQQSECG